MLQLKHRSGGYELVNKNRSVILLEHSLSLGEENISSPGEYEADGVEVICGESAALIIWEQLQIVYCMSNVAPSEFEQEQFAEADVLIIGDQTGELAHEAFELLLATYGPKIIIVSRESQLNETLKSSLKLEENPIVKLANTNLPEEGQQYIIIG